jgi:hypothetical protein
MFILKQLLSPQVSAPGAVLKANSGLKMTPLLSGRRGRGGGCQHHRGTNHPLPPP